MTEVHTPAWKHGSTAGTGASVEENARKDRLGTSVRLDTNGFRLGGREGLVASLHISADQLREAVTSMEKGRDEAASNDAGLVAGRATGGIAVLDVEVVVDRPGTDEAGLAAGLFMQACEGVERIAAALEEELAEARKFRRSLASRAAVIDASQRRTDENLGKLLG